MNVLVIPEDFRKDQFILKPIVEALMSAIGKPTARVRVLTDPLLGGIDQALDRERLREIIDRYRGMVNLFLLCVDRDGKPGRRQALDNAELFAKELLSGDRVFIAENAWQELEVWVLAGLDLPEGWRWAEIRQEIHPKEVYFEPIARSRRVLKKSSAQRMWIT